MVGIQPTGKYTENAIYQKLLDLGVLKEEEDCKHHFSSSSSLKLPEDLPSIEETAKNLAATLEALKSSGLEKNDVFRLRTHNHRRQSLQRPNF